MRVLRTAAAAMVPKNDFRELARAETAKISSVARTVGNGVNEAVTSMSADTAFGFDSVGQRWSGTWRPSHSSLE